jgi:hypothetical protein
MVLVGYVVILASSTEFGCRGGNYIAMAVLGQFVAVPLTGIAGGIAAYRAARHDRFMNGLGAALGWALVALAAVALIYEITPLNDCYT